MNKSGVDWRDGQIPVSRRFDDPYFSLDGGLAETGHVFLAGNGLPGRFSAGFRIAELGFGTGLNAVATCALWRAKGRPGTVQFTTFEAFPLSVAEMGRALSAFREVTESAGAVLACVGAGGGEVEPGFALEIVAGDARETVPAWQGTVDAWFLDGFAPARNPEMWGEDLLRAVADRLVPGGTLATYTAAGDVRRRLAEAGLEVTRVPGYGRKRHMTCARKPL